MMDVNLKCHTHEIFIISLGSYTDLTTGRYWEMIQRLRINQFYGAPTALRLLLRHGDDWVKQYDRSSLKTLGCGM